MMLCPMCGRETEKLTRDHVVPKWFRNRLGVLGIKMPKYVGRKIQMICGPCNVKKGGALDWDDEYVREFVQTFCDKLMEKLKETERP